MLPVEANRTAAMAVTVSREAMSVSFKERFDQQGFLVVPASSAPRRSMDYESIT
jgi:hypothetical protein